LSAVVRHEVVSAVVIGFVLFIRLRAGFRVVTRMTIRC
jgi:hypothetical protein